MTAVSRMWLVVILLAGIACQVVPFPVWAGIPTVPQRPAFSQAEQDWLAGHPVIRMGIDTGYAPYSFLDEQGNVQGLVREFLDYLETAMGVRFELVTDLAWPQLMAAVKARSIDAVATVTYLPEREEFLLFTSEYLLTPLVIMTRIETPQLNTLEELDRLKLVLVRDYSASRKVMAKYPDLQPDYVSTPVDGLAYVASGRADAYVGVLGVNTYQASQHGIANLKVNAAFDMQTNGQSFGIRKDWPELVRILQKALESMPAQQKNAIYRRWLPLDASEIRRLGEPGFVTRLFPWLLGLLALILMGYFVVVLWNHQLRRELAHRRTELERAQRIAHLGDWSMGPAGEQIQCSDELFRIAGRDRCDLDWPTLLGWIHPDERKNCEHYLDRLSSQPEGGDLPPLVLHLLRPDGSSRWLEITCTTESDHSGKPYRYYGTALDITERKLAEQLQETRIAVLDGLMANQALSLILGEIARRLEAVHPDMRVSILVSDPHSGRLTTAAAPSLPDFFNTAVDGLGPGVGQGSCGTSAATGEPCIVEDIRTHEFWAPYVALAEQAGLRACWSIPFKNKAGKVLGTFGSYYAQPRSPTREELDLIGEFARIASLAVEQARAELSQRQAAAVFESTREGVVITDLQPRIVNVNRAYTAITGYSEEEVLGRNPSLLRSGREDLAFYQAMWSSIVETGHWQGEIWNRRKNGELFPELLAISTVYDADGLPSNYVGVMTDISQLKDSEARLEHLAHYDPLTHLPNRLLLQSRLKHALEAAERHKRRVAVLFIDLDRFKNINDSLGHPVGDELLEALTQRMHARLREGDTLGRLGGDEFLLILEDVQRPENAAEMAKEMIRMLEQSFHLPSGHEVYVGASIGISLFPDDGLTGTALIQHADVALYRAKESGRNTFSFYTPGLTQAADERLGMEARLRRALVQNEFVLHFQPQVDMRTGKITGCEALVRWNDPERGMVSPARFIPLAEETGLIVSLGEWVLHQACVQARAWLDAGLPPLLLSVNLSARQLQQANIVERVAAILNETGLPPACLKLELTESMIMGHGEEAIVLLRSLKALGLGLSIDDFGTGYSSLAYLKRFPIDELKIDQGFVRDIPLDHNDMEIASAIISLARSMRLKVVAEGVETEAQHEFLMQQGCNAFQGFLFSEALPAGEFLQLVRDRAV